MQWVNPQEGDQIMWVNQIGLGLELKAWANKSGNNRVAYRKLSVIPTQWSTTSWDANYSDNLMFDYAPGGRLLNKYPLANNFGKDFYCFVPVVSSLDIRSPENQNLYVVNNNEANLIANNIIPFDDIYVRNTNSTHTYLTSISLLVDRLLNLEFLNNSLLLQNRTFRNTRQFNASNSIKAGRNIFQNMNANNFAQSRQGDVVIKSGANVTFTAGNTVELLPGFETEDGANFKAEIVPNQLFVQQV